MPVHEDAVAEAARTAFYECRAISNPMCTNYVDRVLEASLSNATAVSDVDELESAYIAYMRSLSPHQPSDEEVTEQRARAESESAKLGNSVFAMLMRSILAATPNPGSDSVTYFLPGSGTYQVRGEKFARDAAKVARLRMAA